MARVLSSLFAVIVIALAPSVHAQHTIQLKLTHPLPATHYLYTEAMK